MPNLALVREIFFPAKRSLLDVSINEEIHIGVRNYFQSFAFVSFIPGLGKLFAEQLSIHNILPLTASTLSTASIAGVVASFLVGIGYGGYTRRKDTSEKKSEVIKLNKLLFILFNIAADKYKACLEAKGDDEKKSAENSYNIAISKLHDAISSKDVKNATAVINKTGAKSHIDDKPIKDIIESYYTHREESKDGAQEKLLWETLLKDKKKLNIFGDDKFEEVESFVDFQQPSERMRILKEENERIRADFENKLKALTKLSKKISKNHETVNHVDMLVTHADVQDEKNDQINMKECISKFKAKFDEIFLLGWAFVKIITGKEKDADEARVDAELKKKLKETITLVKSQLDNEEDILKYTSSILEAATAEFEQLQQKINNPVLKANLREIYSGTEGLRTKILSAGWNLKRFSLSIQDNAFSVFESNGSFRKFCRDNKVDGMIHREERIRSVKGSLIYYPKFFIKEVKPIATIVSLGMTGVNLYLASVVFGATAIGAGFTFGLIIPAILLACTAIYFASYYITKQVDNHRSILRANLERECKALIENEKTERQKNSAEPDKEQKKSSHESISIFATKAEQKRAASSGEPRRRHSVA